HRAVASAQPQTDRLTTKHAAARLDAADPPLPPPGGTNLVQSVRVVDATTLTVDLGPRFTGFRTTSQPVDATMRLVIDLVAPPETTPPAPAPVAPPPPELPPMFGQPGALHTIAIDPGHGGEDDGVRSASGAK